VEVLVVRLLELSGRAGLVIEVWLLVVRLV